MTLTVRPTPWRRPPVTAPLPAPGEAASGISVTDRAILRDGMPWVPVSGELHYSRTPRARWGERLRQMRAGGISIASTYVFWIHHVRRRGDARFDGNLDVGAFVDECAAAGLEVALRIGPWAHGEARNGGFPDWVQDEDVAHRTDDPAYLALVTEWFAQLADALDGRAQPGGPVIAVQLENELYDRPEHLVTLQRLARKAGIAAPLWTATAWGGAQLPAAEVFPLYGGYGDGFWTEPDAPWDPTFRAHYFFSHEWDDPGVGADVRATQGFGSTSVVTAASAFPPATCELAGGMATAYHRRPWPRGRDVAAVAHGKIGNGSAWQGYYMYAGGTNPGLDLEESHATGYPNDMQRLGYDFHAAIGEAGELADSSRLLRDQHAFLDAFGPRLSELPSALPDVLPSGIDDARTLRWAVRSDGSEGFVFIARHQPHEPLDTYTGAQFEIGGVVLPSAPIDIPPGTLARWPFGLRIGGTTLRWATASALTLLPSEVPTLVLVADDGIPVELALDDAEPVTVEPSLTTIGLNGADLLVLPAGAPVWVGPHRSLLLSDAELAWADEVLVRSRSEAPEVRVYDPESRAWSGLGVAGRGVEAKSADVQTRLSREAGPVPADYGFAGERHSAPALDDIDDLAAIHRLDLPEWAYEPDHDAVVEIDWAGDAGQLRVGGRIVDDRYWDGSRWIVSVQDMGLVPGETTLHLLPLSSASTVWLPEPAAARREAAAGALLAIDAVRVVSRGLWRAVQPLA
ncbi:beta-galactosidase [Planococcus sp. APC 4015]|nr:beta-galactosidase [Planococcus sp. APC 4015]